MLLLIGVETSSARYGDTYQYRQYVCVAIPLFDWDDFIDLFSCTWPALSMAVSDNPVSIEPGNAGGDETKPEIELVAKKKTITPVWKHFGFEADEKGKPRSPDRPKCSLSTRSGS